MIFVQIGNENIEYLINGRAGLISKLKEIKPISDLPFLNRFLSVIYYINDNKKFIISGSGFSLDKNEALIASVGEAIERYCAHIIDKDIRWASYEELQMEVSPIDLYSITRLTDEQYYKKYNHPPVSEKTTIGWSAGIDFHTGNTIYLPTEMIYLRNIQTPTIRDVISTGLACGPTERAAIESGLLECIERDSFMLFWLFLRAKYEIDLSKLEPTHPISELYELAQSYMLNIKVLDVTTDLNIPTIVTILQADGMPGFYMGCASHIHYEQAIYKSLKEGLGGYSIYYESVHVHNKKGPNSSERIQTLDDHVLYYFVGNNDSILEGISYEGTVDATQLFKAPQSSLESLSSIPIYYKNITSEDILQVGVSVVRVVCPTLCYLPIGQPFLLCERIEKYKTIYKTNHINLEPHPFP